MPTPRTNSTWPRVLLKTKAFSLDIRSFVSPRDRVQHQHLLCLPLGGQATTEAAVHLVCLENLIAHRSSHRRQVCTDDSVHRLCMCTIRADHSELFENHSIKLGRQLSHRKRSTQLIRQKNSLYRPHARHGTQEHRRSRGMLTSTLHHTQRSLT
jgi:hypothetical protein